MSTTKPETKPKSDQIELGCLWKKSGQSQDYLSGEIDLKHFGLDKKVRIVVFSNKFKKEERQPDLRIFISKDFASKTDGSPGTSSVRKSAAVEATPDLPDDDNIL